MSWSACVIKVHQGGKTDSYLMDGRKFKIGRSPDCDLVIADAQISRKHLGILNKDGEVFLKDLGSANGSFVGKEKVPFDVVLPYREGQEIRIGNTNILVTVELIKRKIDIKSLDDQDIPSDDSMRIISLLESAKTRAKRLNDDFEQLIERSRAEMVVESQKSSDEAKRISAQIIAESKHSAEKIIQDGESAAKLRANQIVEGAKQEAAIVIQAGHKKVEDLISDAEKKGQALLEGSKETVEALARDQEAAKNNHELSKKFLEESKEKSKILLQEALQDAQKKAAALLDDALKSKEHAERLLDDARREISATQEKGDAILLEARTKSDLLIASAKTEAEAVAAEAAKKVYAQAEDFYAEKKRDAEASAQRILQDVQIQVDKLYEGVELKKKEELQRLAKDSEALQAKLHQDHLINKDRLETDYQLKIKLFDEECAIRRKQLEKELHSEKELLDNVKKEVFSVTEKSHSAKLEFQTQKESLQSLINEIKSYEFQFAESKKNHDLHKSKVEDLIKECAVAKDELNKIMKQKSDETHQISVLKKRQEEELAKLDKDGYDQRLKIQSELAALRERETREIEKARVLEIENIENFRKKTLSEIVKNKDAFRSKLAEKVEARIVAILKNRGVEVDLKTLHTEMLGLVQSSLEEQSFELSQGNESDLKQVITAETGKRREALKAVAVATALIASVAIGVFVYQGGSLGDFFLGKNAKGETGAEEFSRVEREKRDSKKFDPPQSDSIKSNYTDNVLYTRNFVSTYQDLALQEKWIHELNSVFSKEFELDDDAIVKFIALESTLIGKLQEEKAAIVPDYADVGIEKMRKVEKDTLNEMVSLLKDPKRMQRFQSFSEKFWLEELNSRKPASK